MTRLRGALAAGLLLIAAACGGGGTNNASTSNTGSAQPLPAGVLTHVEIPPITAKTAAIDIMLVDQSAHLLYVADRTDNGVDVLDVSTPHAKYMRTLDVGGSAPNGIVLVPEENKLFTGNNDSTVSIIDTKTGKILANVNTGGKGRADEMDYDPKDHKVYVANSGDNFVTVFDTKNNTIIKKFDKIGTPGNGLEQPRYNPADGKFYLTLSDDNQIMEFDPTSDSIVKTFDVVAKCNPMGFSINPKTQQALVGCGNKKAPITAVWDIKAGKVTSTFTDAGAGDVTLYDEKVDRWFFAASNFTKGGQPAPELAVFSGDPVAFKTAITTAVGSHAVAFDETNKVVYVQDQMPLDGGLYAFPLPQT